MSDENQLKQSPASSEAMGNSMEAMAAFHHKKLGEIRTMTDVNGEVLFAGIDVAQLNFILDTKQN